MLEDYQFDSLRGSQIGAHVNSVAALRMEVFREYPYLYDGDAEYEEEYLKALAESDKSLVVLVRHSDQVVGASTALPLTDADPPFQEPFSRPQDYFYFGESVLQSAHRGKGIGKAFFDIREAAARKEGYVRACFCAVRRPDAHPLRPADYRHLGPFWQRRGFQKTSLTTAYPWKDIDEDQESEKIMEFWEKGF